MGFSLKCIACHSTENEQAYTCSKCKGLLEVLYDKETFSSYELAKKPGIWKYSKLFPCGGTTITLHEGNTPLYHINNLFAGMGIHVKFEGLNPTGSFKDRGMAVGMSKALEFGFRKVVCASTGNTSASMAAYAAKAGVMPFVYVPKGKIALPKLAQALVYGAKIVQTEGTFDDALRQVFGSTRPDTYILNSINPYRPEGQKTLAFELSEQLEESGGVDTVVVPVGNAANISAIWKGFKEYKQLGLVKKLPRMIGVQAAGANPVYKAFLSGKFEPVANPDTIASAIRIGNPVSHVKAIAAAKESNGFITQVSDAELLNALAALAKHEGVFCEPASATTVAAVARMVQNNEIAKDENVVCVLTGNGLKDPETAAKAATH